MNFTEKEQRFSYLKNYDYLCCRNYKKILSIMARPIKPTPILYGEDAIRFEMRMQNVKSMPKREREEQRRAYEWFMSKLQN
ncbi:hypothetical protein FACS189430_06340 [Bacteroidia bacterium]|nr:hypothetical protein FACS189430_06340 [Bacteroidia bacterium]